MLRFFSKIRYQLAAQNRAAKYLRYAIGEIVLVVIGILIALQINIWNEQRKQHLNDLLYLENLRTELINDTIDFYSRINRYNQINDDIKKTVDLLNNTKQITNEQDSLISRTIGQLEVILPLYKAMDKNTLVTSGNLIRINPELNRKYQDYMEYNKYVYDLTSKLTESLQNSIDINVYTKIKFNYTNTELKQIEFDFEEIRNDRMFVNMIERSYDTRNVTIGVFKNQKQYAIEILTIIDSILYTLENRN